MHPVRTSRHKLPRRPGRAGGLARPDGARDAVHLGRPFADQDWPDMAVVQDGAATAAGAGKPLCAAVVSVSAVCTDLRWLNCAMVQAVRESPVGSARRSPTVEHHPVGDSVTTVARVVRPVQATPDLCGELSLLIDITGRKVSPCRRRDQACQADGFGIDRREQPRGAERRRLGARRDEDLAAAGPFAVNTDAVVAAPIRPEVAAEQEPGQHRVVAGPWRPSSRRWCRCARTTSSRPPRSVAGWSMSGGPIQ